MKVNGTVYEFDSMSEYVKHLTEFDKNSVRLEESVRYDFNNWYGTKTFEDAIKLAKEGWTDCANALNKKLNFQINNLGTDKMMKTFLSQVGYQAIVPLYLNGCPTNMVNKKLEVKKQKIITIVKSVGFRAEHSVDDIKEESIKTLMLVYLLEKKGYRVNLYTLNGYNSRGQSYFVRVKIKSAGERLNVSKLAFPLVHPSMLRRLNFRFREINKTGIGGSIYDKEGNLPAIKKGEVFIPSFMKMDIDSIKSIDDIENGYTFEEKHERRSRRW